MTQDKLEKLAKTKKVEKYLDHPVLSRLITHHTEGAPVLSFFDDKTPPEDPQQFLDWLDPYFRECTRCILHKNRNKVVTPDGRASADIFVMLEGPAFLEDLTGIPITGPMEIKSCDCSKCLNVNTCFRSRVIQKPNGWPVFRKEVVKCDPEITSKDQFKGNMMVNSVGAVIDGILLNSWGFQFPRDNWLAKTEEKNFDVKQTSPWYFTNAQMCRSWDPIDIKETSPTSLTKGSCKPWLLYQWAAVNPKIIIAFGNHSGQFFLSEDAVKGLETNELTQTKFGPLIYSYHPSYYMREKRKEVLGLNMAKIKRTFEKALAATERINARGILTPEEVSLLND